MRGLSEQHPVVILCCLHRAVKERTFTRLHVTLSGRNSSNMTAVEQEEPYDYLFKIVLIGDAGVGKTCIVQRFKSGTFIERHGSTIGVDFTMKTIHLDGHRVKVLCLTQSLLCQ